MSKVLLPLALSLALAVPALALAQAAAPKPHAGFQLPKPDAEGQKPRAVVTLAPYRYDDILWENDRTAHRIYGAALEAAEPPSTSGVDAWGKTVRWPYMDRQLRTGDQHADHGEGLDFYDVGAGRGAGGLGVWQDNKLWTSRNWKSWKVLQSGGDTASFSVDYAPWPVDVDRKVWETRTFTLPLGSNFTRMVSTISSDKPGPLIVGIGISKRKRASGSGTFTKDLAPGRVSFWEPTDPDKGAMAIALMVDPKALVEVRQDFDNYLVLIRVEPGKPFVYYMGAAWDRGLDFHDRAGWEAYVKAQTPDFDPGPAAPAPQPVAAKARIGLDLSIKLARGAIEACRALGQAVSASVVDSDGVPVVVLRSEDSAKAPVAAPLKAATAAAFDAPGSAMEPREAADPAFARLIATQADRYNAHGGSLPLHKDGKVIGGLAVADTRHDTADTCARQALAAYAKDLN